MKIYNLKFEHHPNHDNGVRATIFFPNGYGASIISSKYSYSNDDQPYELAVMKGASLDKAYVCYDTPITDDVIGWLTLTDVMKTLAKIESLNSGEHNHD